MIPADLAQAGQRLMADNAVLVGLDFDGVLAPIVEQRDAARPVAGGMAAVRRLAGLAGVEVALVSGRALDSLLAVSGITDDDPVSLVGSHGAEARLHPSLRHRSGDLWRAGALTQDEGHRLAQVVAALTGIVQDAGPGSGLDVELKPAGAVLHTRLAPPPVARAAESAAMAGPATWLGVHTTLGKAVVEMSVVQTSKGVALQRLRGLASADAILYAGDDVTDETAFAVLGPDDVGIKVGPGETLAAYRLDGPADVAELLQLLVAERSQR